MSHPIQDLANIVGQVSRMLALIEDIEYIASSIDFSHDESRMTAIREAIRDWHEAEGHERD